MLKAQKDSDNAQQEGGNSECISNFWIYFQLILCVIILSNHENARSIIHH